ncbi:hypothetical protein Isolate57629_49520 [Mycobacteroides abscessus subsp. abscessus]
MPPTDPPPTGQLDPRYAENPAWEQQWAKVPAAWRAPVYQIDTAPFNEVFVQNRYYTTATPGYDGYDFTPPGPPRFAHELAWWVYTCWREGLRRIDPAKIVWFTQALPEAAAEYRRRRGRSPASLLDITVPDIVRHATVLFEQRRHRLPTPPTAAIWNGRWSIYTRCWRCAAPRRRGGAMTPGTCGSTHESHNASTNPITSEYSNSLGYNQCGCVKGCGSGCAPPSPISCSPGPPR